MVLRYLRRIFSSYRCTAAWIAIVAPICILYALLLIVRKYAHRAFSTDSQIARREEVDEESNMFSKRIAELVLLTKVDNGTFQSVRFFQMFLVHIMHLIKKL